MGISKNLKNRILYSDKSITTLSEELETTPEELINVLADTKNPTLLFISAAIANGYIKTLAEAEIH